MKRRFFQAELLNTHFETGAIRRLQKGKNLHLFNFTKADRILSRKDFVWLFKYGKRLHSKYFLAFYAKGRCERTRLGITVSKKVGGAPTRNRIKRLIREYYRINKDKFAGQKDINIVAKKEVAALSYEQIFSSLQNLFCKIGRDFDF